MEEVFEVTHRVFLDVDIDKQRVGMDFCGYIFVSSCTYLVKVEDVLNCSCFNSSSSSQPPLNILVGHKLCFS